MYRRGVTDFAQMTTLAKPVRTLLAERFVVDRPAVVRAQISQDGTAKWLLRFADGNEAEAVFIPEEDRGTLCVSSQVGCTLTCSFCHTGTQRLVRNLSAAEIVGQVMAALDHLDGYPTARIAASVCGISATRIFANPRWRAPRFGVSRRASPTCEATPTPWRSTCRPAAACRARTTSSRRAVSST